MFCESYRQALSTAVAAGEPLPREVARHLAGCNACSAAFVAEKALFAAIDGSLYAAANADLPASLVPGVRDAVLQKDFPARHIQWRAILVFGSALLIVGSLSFWHSRPISRTGKALAVASRARPEASYEEQIKSPAGVSRGVAPSAPNKSPVTPPIAARSGLAMIVIVSPQEENALKKYAVLVNANIGKNLASDVTRWDVRADLDPLEIAEIDLSQLAIQPLEHGEVD
jgi:anti-sigma factor RsiW